jgi:hypothetical protein
MPVHNLQILPKVSDSWTYLYVEHAIIEQDDKAIAILNKEGKTPVPCATLSLLMLGPGISITHQAIKTLAENGCMVAWVGEEGVRFYAVGMGETRSAANTLRQAAMHSDPDLRLRIVRRMYEMRFPEKLDPRERVFETHMRGGAVRPASSGMVDSTNRMTGGAPNRLIGLFRQPTVVCTGSFMLQLSLRATHLRSDSFIPARCSRSSTMSPIFTKRTSPFRQLFAARQPVRVD